MHFWGMHLIWWIFWLLLVFSFFALIEPVPRRGKRRPSSLDILQREYAAGRMTTEEYEERKNVLLRDLGRVNPMDDQKS